LSTKKTGPDIYQLYKQRSKENWEHFHQTQEIKKIGPNQHQTQEPGRRPNKSTKHKLSLYHFSLQKLHTFKTHWFQKQI
jgi:hypothetical protein